MQQIITLLHILIAISVIALVLIQHGKGADAGAAFGSGGGASGTMFGSQGNTPFLVKVTAVLALLFFVTSGVLDLTEGRQAQSGNALDIPSTSNQLIPTTMPQNVPVTPSAPDDKKK